MRPGPWGVLLGRRLEERGWRGQRDSGSPSKGSDSVPPVSEAASDCVLPSSDEEGMDPQIAPSNGLFASSSATWWKTGYSLRLAQHGGLTYAACRATCSSVRHTPRQGDGEAPECRRIASHGGVLLPAGFPGMASSAGRSTPPSISTLADHTSIAGRPALAGGRVIVDACLLRQVGTIPPA